MDEREWRKEGKVVVEVTAKGKGVIPSHLQLFDFARGGFDVEVTDNGLSVGQFVSDGRNKTAQADRGWQFTYHRKKDLRGNATLKFPTVKSDIKTSTTEYKHYQDADLVALEPKQALAGISLPGGVGSVARNITVVIFLLAAGAGFYWFRRTHKQQWAAVAGLDVPAHLSPFSTVVFLRRIQREHAPKLDASARESLQAEIREIESAFFSNESRAHDAPDLESIARKWLQAVA